MDRYETEAELHEELRGRLGSQPGEPVVSMGLVGRGGRRYDCILARGGELKIVLIPERVGAGAPVPFPEGGLWR